jgi:two-component system chemotaxis sensor kinase CheA
MIINRSFDAKMLEDINPIQEFSYVNELTGTQKTLRSSFTTVDRGWGQFFILGTLEDITAQKELARQLADEENKREEEMRALFQVIQVEPRVFNDFIEDTEYEFDRINDILKDKKLSAQDAMVDIYQSVHAIKSNALILGLENFSGKLHELEAKIKELRDGDEVSFEDVLHITVELEKVMKEKDKFRETIDKIHSFRVGMGDSRRQDRYVLVETLTKACEKASAALNKKVNMVVEDIDGIVLEKGPRRIIKEILTQLVRNSVYHGIENAEEREASGKDRIGNIRLSIKCSDNKIHIKLSDDGKGLDFDKIRRKAEALRMFKDKDAANDKNQLLKIIFSPGFSTEETANLHAGRGIGLNLVRERIRDLHGSIKLQSEPGKGTTFNIFLPMESMPAVNKAS